MDRLFIVKFFLFVLGLSIMGNAWGCYICRGQGGSAYCEWGNRFGAAFCYLKCEPGGQCGCLTSGMCEMVPPGDLEATPPDLGAIPSAKKNNYCPAEAQCSSEREWVDISQVDLEAATATHPLLGKMLILLMPRGESRLIIDSFIQGMFTRPLEGGGGEVEFEFDGETAKTADGVWFQFQFDGHPDISELEGELILATEDTQPRGMARVKRTGRGEAYLLEW